MTVRIERHGLPAGPEAEAYAQRIGQFFSEEISQLEESTAVLDGVFDTSILNLRARSVLDPRAAELETWEAASTAMQVGSALFAVTGMSEGTVECRIDRKVRSLRALGPLPTADAGTWLQAFWLAVICREQERMTQLCEIPLDRLRARQGKYDEYVYHWVDTLQTYWLRRPGLVEKLTATFEASDTAVAHIAPRDLLDGILYPPINLFYRLVIKDEEGFGPALVEALKLHRAYWTLNEDRKSDIDGTIAIGPLAIACLAFDGGFPIEVESEYLPHHLLRHGWLGEFAT
ncbi:immunity 49 family protein [Streptomyces sp. NPDC046925]|uniref:immunity 49 family protein n=1 Tax=Streptomyces sp. NPDC046925 TaxID=3155375 RepID=UPI0033C7AA59